MAKAKKTDDEQTIFTILYTFFLPSDKPLTIEGFDKLPIEEQLQIVVPANICTQDKRREITNKTLESVPDLKDYAYKRIRFKSLLSSYYRAYVEVKQTKVDEFNNTQLALSLFEYIIHELNTMKPTDDKAKKALEKEKKALPSSLKFVGYLIKFCEEEKFNGEELHKFWSEVTKNGTKTGGFGLKFVQKICNKFSLKFGKFAKIKKKVGVWFTDNVERSNNLKNKPPPQEPAGGQPQQSEQKEPTKGPDILIKHHVPENLAAKWFWMDMEEYEWIPFSKDDQQILHQSYAAKHKVCHITKGKYRIEFDDEGAAAGNQFENNIADPPNKMVVRAEPEDGEIHGMPVAEKPRY
eukprot:305395_1